MIVLTDLRGVAEVFADPQLLLLMLVGTVAGVMVGAIPGLTGAMLIALTLPLTFAMDGSQAMALLVSMYVGSVSGGLITATLLRMPGTPASIMTTLDGYPMAKRGMAGRALGLGAGASLFGGLISWLFLFLLARPIAVWSTRFGPFEFVGLVLLALVLIAGVGGKSLVKGLFAACLGVFLTIPGVSPANGESRWTLGIAELSDGFKLLPVLIGLFAVNQMLQSLLETSTTSKQFSASRKGMLQPWTEWRKHVVNLLRSSCLGTWVGVLPGVGANIGSVIAYSAARKASRKPEEFGSGSEEGIVASESANNATVGGALIPLISMGIPGSVIDTILLGALIIHGLQPGPLLFDQNPDAVYVIIAAMLAANLIMFLFVWSSVGWIAKLASMSRAILLPSIMVFCVVGSFALANRMFDVWVMLGFGLVGFTLERCKIPLAPLVIGFVLAPILEKHLATGLMQTGGSLVPLFTRPIALSFVLLAAAVLAWNVFDFRRSSD
ncbi:MAG: tripartite tricarboxylate transporter permease [Pirellulaceae bacterium]